MTAGPDARLPALMRRVAQGDQEAFSFLYDELAPLVFSIARRVLVDRAQAEEAAQEAFVQIWQQAPRFDVDRGSVRAWAATIAHRKAVDRVRSAQASREREARAAQESREQYEHVEDEVFTALESERVLGALQALSEAQREAIELAYFHGLSQSETADRLGVPLGTVKTRTRDGLRRLRTLLGGRDGTG